MHQLRQNNLAFSRTISIRWCGVPFIFFLLLTFFSYGSPAAPAKVNNATLVDYLSQEKLHMSDDIKAAHQHSLPKNAEEYAIKMKQLTTILTLTKAKIDSLEGFLENQNKYLFGLNQRLKHLQQLPLTSGEVRIQERVAKVEALITINKRTSGLIEENLDLAQQFQSVLDEELNELDLWNENYKLEQKLVTIKNKKKQLLKELSTLYFYNVDTKNKKHPEISSNTQVGYEANVLVNNQHIGLLHLQINALNIQKAVVKADKLVLHNPDTKTLQSVTDTYTESIHQYADIENSLQQILGFLNKEALLELNKDLKKSISKLQNLVNVQMKDIKADKMILVQELRDYQTQLKKLISSRQSLAQYNINSWPQILNKIINIPSLFYNYTKTLSLKVYDSYLWLDAVPLSILWVILGSLLAISLLCSRVLRNITVDKERSSLSGYLYDGALTLIQRNIPYLCIFTMIWSVLYMTNISFTNYQLLINLMTVWLTFRALILIARLVLLERISDSSGKDVKLYYRIKWLLLFGGWTTALMTFSHLLPLSLLLQDIFNRLFMLFILSVSLVAWKSKDVIPYLLRPLLKGKKRYFKNAVSLLVVLVPVTLFTTAVIGLLGFINLAWTMSRYQAYVLLVLVGYVLSRGLLFDILELFSQWMITSLRNGWLWIEVFLKPIDKILRVVLLLASTFVLFQLFGWHSDSLVIISLEKIAKYSIINLTGIHITVESLIEFFILLTVFTWASKWTREFCYRWLYAKAKDPGIRNSLSVFTQYSVILLGSFITLRVLGLDFSGMSIIFGGLAVGMGFGLRDFASNVVGGIMLLIERPVREGDLVSIGEYEGQVSHIGIRSMRVSSWDNTEVLVPNAETFNKPFTNWTHQDGIVRTVIPIKVSRSDDPVMIQQLILDVLAIIPEIVSEPPVQVFLKKIDTALIEFEARYFINVHTHNRVEVRSKVLFAITAQFKAAGVKPPVEPITVEFKEGQGEFFNKQFSTTD